RAPRAVMGPGATEPVGFVVAVGSRLGGAVVNVALNALSAAVGWAMGNALPSPAGPASIRQAAEASFGLGTHRPGKPKTVRWGPPRLGEPRRRRSRCVRHVTEMQYT